MPRMSKRLLLVFSLAVPLLQLGRAPAWADVPDDKTGRILEYQSHHLEFTSSASNSYSVREGTGTASIQIGDRTLAERAGDQDLLDELRNRQRWRTFSQLAWSVGIPLGLALFIDNFFGNPRPAGLKGLPQPVVSFYPGNDWRSFALATSGATLAAYGTWSVGSWVAERLGFSFANLLTPAAAQAAVHTANNRLLDDLALSAQDVASGSPALASANASQSASPSTGVKGEEGSAAYYLSKAFETLRNQRGEGYRLYLVYTKDLADKTGKLQRGAWRYCFYHPQRLESLEVDVPVFGSSPTVGPAPDAYKNDATIPGLEESWHVDSPKALSLLQDALVTRGIPWLVQDTTMILYPSYGNFLTPIWLLDQGQGPFPVGIDASRAIAVDLTQAGLNRLPGTAGSNPSGVNPTTTQP